MDLFPYGSLSAAVEDGGIAYKNFFDSVTGRRKGPRVGYPRFKSRHYSEQVAVFPAGAFTINGGWEGTRNRGGKVWVSKIGYLHVNWHRPLTGPPTSMRVKLRRDGKYVVSFVVKAPKHVPTTPTRGNRAAGVDMGLTDYAAIVYSDGTREKIDNPRFRRHAERKVARLQQAVSRKQKGSKNRDKARVKLARVKQREQELRRNHAFQLAKRLVRENQMIAVEDLNVEGLARGWLAKSITDAGWGIFLRQLEYLCDINEREFVMVDRFFPSTQLCSQCGERTGKKALHVREFVCPFCGALLDRDFNAATNIMVAQGVLRP